MDSTEIPMWEAYFETGGSQAIDHNVALIRTTIARAGGLQNANTGEPITELDYLPPYMKPEIPQLTPEQVEAEEKAAIFERNKRSRAALEAAFAAVSARKES